MSLPRQAIPLCSMLLSACAADGDPGSPLLCREVAILDRSVSAISLAVESSQRVQLVAQDRASGSLVHAAWDGGAWQVEDLGKPVLSGTAPVALVAEAGRPHIAYASPDTVAHLTTDGTGEGWSMTALGARAGADRSIGLARTAAGPAVAFATEGGILFTAVAAANPSPVLPGAGRDVHLVVDGAGEPEVVYLDREGIRAARPDGPRWSSAVLVSGEIDELSAARSGQGLQLAWTAGGHLYHASEEDGFAGEELAEATAPRLASSGGRVHILYRSGERAVVTSKDVDGWTHRPVPGRTAGGAAAIGVDETGALHVVHDVGAALVHARCEAP